MALNYTDKTTTKRGVDSLIGQQLIIGVKLHGQDHVALWDTGSPVTLMSPLLVSKLQNVQLEKSALRPPITLTGQLITLEGSFVTDIQLGEHTVKCRINVTNEELRGYGLIIGTDVHKLFGSTTIDYNTETISTPLSGLVPFATRTRRTKPRNLFGHAVYEGPYCATITSNRTL